MPLAPSPCSVRDYQQAFERPGAGAGERGRREQREPAEVNALVSHDLAERAERQHRREQRDLVDIDDPDDIGRAHMQVGGNRGQCDIGDRGVERRHRKRGEDGKDCPASALRRQSVGHTRCHRARLFQHRGKSAPAAAARPRRND